MPRKPPWYHAHAGLLWGLMATMGAAWGYDRLQVARYGERAAIMPDRRDREVDSLERRISALEARCGSIR